MKKEIEVKVKLDNFKKAIEELANLGCVFTEPSIQEDTIFINYNRPFIEFTTDDPFLRIRKSEGKVIFTFKKGEEMNSVEKEFIVNDGDQLKETLLLLGFRPEVQVCKTRQKTRYKDYEICLDRVDKLGSFIELEKITNEDPKKIQTEMIEFLENIGIESKNRVFNGYDTLLWLKNNPDYKKIK